MVLHPEPQLKWAVLSMEPPVLVRVRGRWACKLTGGLLGPREGACFWEAGWKGELTPPSGEGTPDLRVEILRSPEVSEFLLDSLIEIFALQATPTAGEPSRIYPSSCKPPSHAHASKILEKDGMR